MSIVAPKDPMLKSEIRDIANSFKKELVMSRISRHQGPGNGCSSFRSDFRLQQLRRTHLAVGKRFSSLPCVPAPRVSEDRASTQGSTQGFLGIYFISFSPVLFREFSFRQKDRSRFRCRIIKDHRNL